MTKKLDKICHGIIKNKQKGYWDKSKIKSNSNERWYVRRPIGTRNNPKCPKTDWDKKQSKMSEDQLVQEAIQNDQIAI